MNKSTNRGQFRPAPWMQEGRIAGGFAFIDSAALANVWRSYERNDLKLVDVRSWLALHEMMARRRAATERRRPTYSDLELARLTGTPEARRASSSRRRLIHCGSIEWSESTVRFRRREGEVIGGRARIPVPRRVLRHLARQGTAADVATVIGHAARCLYYQRDAKQLRSGGACTASWVAQQFGVGERSVHRSRQRLIELGWLRPVEDGRQGGRLGARFVIDLAWRRPDRGHETAAQREGNDADSAAPTIHHEPSLRIQRPELDAGVSTKPILRNVVPADLSDPRRLEALFEEAGKAGLVSRTEAGKLSFFAAAERAKRCGAENPCGFFAAMVRRGLWRHIAGVDEDRARKQIAAAYAPLDEGPRRNQRQPWKGMEGSPARVAPGADADSVGIGYNRGFPSGDRSGTVFSELKKGWARSSVG
ncbi:MAG: hypothetical protein KF688_01230 [Pirellulales bacterium]|nr:hypothetical protein [Pirellulales bacterium]